VTQTKRPPANPGRFISLLDMLAAIFLVGFAYPDIAAAGTKKSPDLSRGFKYVARADEVIE
jgi:hypothetical protein